MKHSWHWMRTLLTLTLVLTLCGLTPAAVPDVGYAESAAEGTTAVAAYGMATADDVIVRKQPSTSANYWFRINTGFVCEILDTVVRGDTCQANRRIIYNSPALENAQGRYSTLNGGNPAESLVFPYFSGFFAHAENTAEKCTA